MLNPPLTEAQKQEAVKALQEHGNKAAAARALGISRSTFRHRYDAATRDPAIQASMAAVGTSMVPALVWAKTKSEDGTSYSTLLKPAAAEDNALDRIREALEGMKPAKLVKPPKDILADLCTVYPIADRHQGMVAWAKETGSAYDSQIASDRLKDWFSRCAASSPNSDTAVILDIGDGEHMDDQNNVTPKSKHQLDVDTRVFKTLDTSVESLAFAVEVALKKHNRVIVRILPGNHNPTLYMAVMFALGERYRNEPRVEVQKVPGEFFVHTFGECLLSAHHGDKGKAERMVLFLADEYAKEWGQTKYRFLWTGHLHHHKSADVGGVKWEQLRAMTERDAYAVANAFCARAQLNAITLHKSRGEIQRVSVGV